MLQAALNVALAAGTSFVVCMAPGAALLLATGWWRVVPWLARPAAAVAGSVLVASAVLMPVLAFGGSVVALASGVAALSLVLALVGWRRRAATSTASVDGRPSAPVLAALAVATLLLMVIAVIDAPHVRSDTYWHVALIHKVATLDALTSQSLAFEAGSHGNANYPLPTFHALLGIAAALPRVTQWTVMWFATLWLAPVAMWAFGALAAALVGARERAGVAGAWTFLAVVVLGYGPWYMASRYVTYPGQVAIYVLLPLVLLALVRAAEAERAERRALVAIAAGASIGIGLLHGNYVLYVWLFAIGGVIFTALARRPVRELVPVAAAAVVAGGVTLALQLPWIRRDANFLRGDVAPAGEPSAFLRHRDVLVGSEQSFHLEIGSLATQPMLVAGALAIPLLLAVRRTRPGPWLLAGGSVAIVVLGLAAPLLELLDRLGSVTPATRLDRVYPAAVGVLAIALAVGSIAARLRTRLPASRIVRALALGVLLAAIAGTAHWVDAHRFTGRVLVTPYLESRWVGGLEARGIPRTGVAVATIATVLVGLVLARRRLRRWDRTRQARASADAGVRLAVTTLVLAAIVVGLAEPNVERLRARWQPEAYVTEARRGAGSSVDEFSREARAVIRELPTDSVLFVNLAQRRVIPSLVAVRPIDESILRAIAAAPPPTVRDARRMLDGLIAEWDIDYVASRRGDPAFARFIEAAHADPVRFELLFEGEVDDLVLFRVRQPVSGIDATAMQLLASAHPDDEVQAWGALEPDADTYSVFTVMTRGEQTNRCDPGHEVWATLAPEQRPEPMPDRPGSERCAAARLDSWHRFLDGMARDSRLDIDAREDMRRRDVSGTAEAWFGPRSARIAFTAPDGELTAAQARAQLARLLELQDTLLPDVPLARIAVGGYHNRDEALGAVYTHPDHAALQRAFGADAFEARAGAWIPVGANDPRANATRDLPRGEYDAMMRVRADGSPVGWFQRTYRWLTFGGPRGAWAVSEFATHAPSEVHLWPRRQRFLVTTPSR